VSRRLLKGLPALVRGSWLVTAEPRLAPHRVTAIGLGLRAEPRMVPRSRAPP